MIPIVYGIPNCDTVRRARTWLGQAGIAYAFHDYKRTGAEPDRLQRWAAAVGWERLLNRTGTTFRKLPEAERQGLDEPRAIALMVAHPSLIRRPVVEYSGGLLVGYASDIWASALAAK